MSLKSIFILGVLVILANCSGGTKSLYSWNNYEETLYKYNKNNLNAAEFEEEMSMVLVKSEKIGRVPPGLYAEYGYILLESGKFEEAVKYFTKESQTWPESKKFMSMMIKRTELQKKQKAGK